MLKFTDPEVSAKFECLVEKDRMVEQPGTYSGLLSNITPAMAYRMVRCECTHVIALKETPEKLAITEKAESKKKDSAKND